MTSEYKGSSHLVSAWYYDDGRATINKDDGVDIRALALTLWRHKTVVLSTFFILTALAVFVVLQLTPRYTAEAVVMLENRQTRIVDFETVLSGLNMDTSVVSSEVEVLRSRSLASRVIERLNLMEDPVFNPDLREQTAFQSFISDLNFLPSLFEKQWGIKAEEDMTDEERAARRHARAIDIFHKNLSVNPITRSLVIKISFQSTDPERAAHIANTVADLYIVDQLEAKFEATKRATEWLNERLDDLRRDVRESERAVEIFRRENNLVELGGKEATSQQMLELNSKVVLSKTELAEAEARLETVQRLLKGSFNDINSAPEVLNSPLIQRLKQEEGEIIRRLSELSTRYGEKHPSILNVRAELGEMRSKIRNEILQIAKGLENEVNVARVRLNTIEGSLKDLEHQQFGENQAMITLRELEREASSNRMLFETFLTRYKETTGQEEIQQADSRLISRADVPVTPSYPQTKLMIILSALGALGIGVAIVFMIEHMDNGFKTPSQIEEVTGYPSLGMIPIAEDMKDGQTKTYITARTSSQAAEALRTLRTSIMLAGIDNPIKTLCVTSSLPGEGKTTTAFWLGQTVATSGQKTLLIDCDLRRPNVHKVAGISNEKSLIDVLAGKSKFSESISIDEKSGLHILTGRVIQASAIDLLSSDQMKNLLKILRKEYDMVILDSPPCLAVSDSRVLGQMVDKTLYAVKWHSTPRDVVLTGLKQFHELEKCDVAGLVLTQVDLVRHAKYGNPEGYYYSRYKDYYTGEAA